MIDVTTIFCAIDDFWQGFKNSWDKYRISKNNPPKRIPSLHPSEIMTIIVFFQLSGYKNFKTYYNGLILNHLKKYFPKAPGYNQFLELKKSMLIPLNCFLLNKLGNCTGISFIDSTPLKVCHLKRSYSSKVFKGMAQKGKSTKGWFYGFKLHLVINEKGEIINFQITPGNGFDLSTLEYLTSNLKGKLFGDRGYISSNMFKNLFNNGVQLITKIKKNMKNKLMDAFDKLLLKKRGVIESIIGQLKEICQIEHTRHRSTVNWIVNILSALSADMLKSNKPSIEHHVKLISTSL